MIFHAQPARRHFKPKPPEPSREIRRAPTPEEIAKYTFRSDPSDEMTLRPMKRRKLYVPPIKNPQPRSRTGQFGSRAKEPTPSPV